MNSRRAGIRSQRGFTLAEILVTTAIFAVIMIAALAVYDKSNRTFKSSTEAADLQQSTRIAFDKVVSDLRIAGFDYNRGGAPSAINAPAWTADTDYPIDSQIDAGNGLVYTCTQSGHSGMAAPPWNVNLGGITVDNTVKWRTDTNGAQYEQQDEQVEYAGQNVVAFRANFDYYSDSKNGSGLENYDVAKGSGDSEKINYTPMDPTTNSPIFPYVTTGNDEIVIYALRSNDASKNTNSISFWADVTIPRSAYPPSGKETKVTVTGIDTTNDNPPYSLVRLTVADANKITWTIDAASGSPIAENIRSLQFTYYKDFQGANVVTTLTNGVLDTGYNADGTTFSTHDKTNAVTGAIGGDGRWDATNVGGTANYSHRDIRSTISAIRVSVAGIASAPEPGYTNATETVAAMKGYKQYTLSSLIVPRNLGLTGFPEPSYNPPSPPTITGICTGHCNAPVLFWDAPTNGPVYQYQIESDVTKDFTAPTTVIVSDPAATSTTLADDMSNPGVMHYYRMYAVNDNGRSIASQPFTATPQNTTKPNPPTGLQASTDQANQITLTWTAPTDNDPSKNTLSCSSGSSASGVSIPSQESIRYRIYRGTTSSFDPAAGQGVLILDTNDQSQPSAAAGGTVTWIDTGAVLTGKTKPNSQSPPAACVNYYYRIQTVDRCATSASYNKSNSTNDAISTYFPSGSINFNGYATSTALPVAPSNLSVNVASSNCPNGMNQNCTVVLTWNKVFADTSGNAIGVDSYRVTRLRKKIFDVSFTTDTSFSSTILSGYSVTAGGTVTWTDNTGLSRDQSDGQYWYYRYTVAARGCSGYSGESNTADYPLTCSTNPAIVAPTANNVGVSGDSPAQAYLFDYNDYISVTDAVGSTSPITSVTFTVKTYPGGVVFFTYTDSSSPFVLTWPSNATDLQIYEVSVAITNQAGCTENRIKYVQDNKAANCAVQVTNTSAVSETTAGSIATASVTYTVRNTGTEDIILQHTATANPVTPSFAGTIDVTWHDPDAGHADMTFRTIDYSTTSDNFIAPASGTIGTSTLTTSRNTPASIIKLSGGASINITLRFQFAKKQSTMTLKPATKICLSYALASEGYAVKHCNIVGQAGSTNNPTTCD